MSNPQWRIISGFTPELEKTLDGKERRAALRAICKAAEQEIRAELHIASQDDDFPGERSFLWEPLPNVCRRLEISQSALTRFLKEFNGLTATQLVDKIRAENLREKFRKDLIAFVTNNFGAPGRQAHTKIAFWQKLKSLRRDPSFSLASYAIQLGFANYSRMYRACLLKFGKTPTQIEDEILNEMAEFYTVASALEARKNGTITEPCNDAWTQAEKSRADWLIQMRTSIGVAPEVEDWIALKLVVADK